MPRKYQPFHVPTSIDPLVSECLKRMNDWLREADTSFSRIDRGVRPSGNTGTIVDEPEAVDHGNLRGLVPVLVGTSISDYNDDHTQYPLIYGRPSGQYIYGSRDTDLLNTFTAKGNLILAANSSSPITSWTGMTADANSVIGEGVIAVIASRDGVAATGATNQHQALADSKGNSWTKLQEFTAQLSSVYYTVSIWTTTVTAAHVASTTTFTVTFTDAVQWMAMEAFKFSLGAGLAFEKTDSLTGSQAGGNPSSIVLPANSGRTLYVRASALEAISGDPASIGWTPTNGWSDFTDDDDHADSSATGGFKCFQARAEWVVKTDEGVTSDPDALPVSPSETWRDASVLMAVQVGVSGTGLLTLRSKNASLAASLYLTGSTIKANQDFFQWRAPGGTTTLSYIDGSDGSFNGPVVASSLSISPGVNLLNTSLFADVLAGSVARGSLIVGNSTPKWSALTLGANGTMLVSDGTDASWSPISTAIGSLYLKLDASNDPITGDLDIAASDLTLIDETGGTTGNTNPGVDDRGHLNVLSTYGTPGIGNALSSYFRNVWSTTASNYYGSWMAESTVSGMVDSELGVGRIGGVDGVWLVQGNLYPSVDESFDIGSATLGMRQIHFAMNSAGALELKNCGVGLHWRDTTDGDLFVGSDNLYPNFYAQRAVKQGSTVATSAEDASNFYQGNWGSGVSPYWPFIEMMYQCGDKSVGNYTTLGEDDTTYIRNGAVSIGIHGNGRGAGGLIIGSNADGEGVYFYGDSGGTGAGKFVFRTMSVSSGKFAMTTFSFAGTRLTDVRPETDNVVDLGVASTNRWKSIYLHGTINHSNASGTIGVFGATPASRTAAYTQTYSTATRTHSNLTSATLTDSTGGTADTTVAAVSGSGADATINNNFADLTAQVNALIVDLANAKQVLNQVIDDQQTYGWFQ